METDETIDRQRGRNYAYILGNMDLCLFVNFYHSMMN